MDPFFACATVDFEKFHHGTPLSDVNSAVEGGPLLLAPTTLDATDAYTKAQNRFDLLCICCELACAICRQQIEQLEFEPHRARVC